MTRTALGLSISGFEVYSVTAPPGTPPERMPTARWMLPPPSVIAEASASPLLGAALRSERELRAGHIGWMTHVLHTLGERWLPDAPKPIGKIVLALAGDASPAVVAECTELARQAGWPMPVIAIPRAACLARHHLADSARPVTALVWSLEFDALEIAVVTVLKNTVRIRARLRLNCTSHAVSDECILAAFRARLGAAWSPADLVGLWPTAWKMRQELETGGAGAVELDANTTLSLTRDELLPHLWPDLETAYDASVALLERLQIPRSNVSQVLLGGKGVLTWRECVARLEAKFACPVQSFPDVILAIGAAQFASDAEVDVGSEDYLDPTWLQSWTSRPSQARARPLPFHATPAPETLPSASRETLADPEDALWAYLQGLSQGNPVRARERLGRLIDRAQRMLDDLTPPAAAPSPALALAEEALAAGRLERVIELSHAALESAPDDPTVFRRMIQLHVAAAERTSRREQAIQWLLCAYRHDSSDREIHRLLAQHYRAQAHELGSAGNLAAALQAGEQSLTYDPFHEPTQKAVAQWRRSLGV